MTEKEAREAAAIESFKKQNAEGIRFRLSTQVNSFIAGWNEALKESPTVKKLAEAVKMEAPRWDSCQHDYEPNLTLDYFRCERCGARPKAVEALEEYRKALEE